MRGLFALGLLLLGGCPEEGTLGRVAPVAVLVPEPGTPIVFEDVVLQKNAAAPRIVTTRNEGDSPLTISAHVETAGPIRVSSFNKRVEPNDYGEVFVRYEPVLHGDSETVLVIETNDPRLPEARYPVRGHARERCRLSGWPAFQRFDLDEVREVYVYNDSKSDCEVTRFFMEGRDLFRVLDAPAVPYVIAAGGELVLHAQHIQRTEVPGAPVRQLHVKERDGSEILVSFQGALPLWSCLGVFPRSLTFPDTDLGVRGHGAVSVYSSCTEPANIHSAHVFNGYYFFDVDQAQFPIVVPPFGEANVMLDYLPFSEFGDDGRLNIMTDDALNRQIRVPLHGTAVIPELLTVPAIDFGSVVAGCSEHLERVPLLAVGKARTLVDALTLQGDPAFTVEGVLIDGAMLPDPTPPLTIPSGSSGQVLIRFAPATATTPERSAKLIVEHNGRDGTRTITLSGRTIAPGPRVETFTAPAAATVDLLMVIDNSRSMQGEEDRLQAGASALAGRLEGTSFHFAVLPGPESVRSPGWPYACSPHPYQLDPSYGDAARRLDALTCALRVGYSNESPPAPITQAIAGLSRAIDPESDPNPLPHFLRKEADLALIFVSDEEDQSTASNLAFRDYLYSVKGSYRPDRITVHAIAGDPDAPVCLDDPWLTPSERYPLLTRETGGTFQDVCTPDYSPLLGTLGDTILAPTNRFDLEQPADPATIQVEVDGVPVAVDPIDGYSFDAAANAIRLNGASRPVPRASVAITYGDDCR